MDQRAKQQKQQPSLPTMDAGTQPQRGGVRTGKKRKGASQGADKKKPRVSRAPAAPPSIELNTSHPALGECSVSVIASLLIAEDPEHVTRALNALLRASADHDANYCLGVGGEKVISSLCHLFDETIGWDTDISGEVNHKKEADFSNLEPSIAHWGTASLHGNHKIWRDMCRTKLASPLASSSNPNHLIDHEAEVPILDMVLMILRNLSYTAQNLRFIVHSESALRILTGALYYRGHSVGPGDDGHSISHHSNMCTYAIQTFINMAPLIDVTGRQIFIDQVFLESDEKEITSTVPDQTSTADGDKEVLRYGVASTLGFGGMHLAKQYDTRAETIDEVSDEMVWASVGSHVEATLAIFPALSSIMDSNDTTSVTTSAAGWHRPSLQSMLELLVALIENTDNKSIFNCFPDFLLHQLTEMLYLHRLGPESLDYIDPINHSVTRVIPLKLTTGYDALIDADIRDRACELLVKLTELSPDVRRRLGMATSISNSAHNEKMVSDHVYEGISPISKPMATSSHRRINVRLYDSIISMISTSSGRADAGSLAAQLLANMATAPENKAGILYCERKLISISAVNPSISAVVCNGILSRI